MMSRGEFPKPLPIGLRAVGWLESEVDAWLETRIAERDRKTALREQKARLNENGGPGLGKRADESPPGPPVKAPLWGNGGMKKGKPQSRSFPQTIYLLRLSALPGVDAIRALRKALKRLLRGYGLKCMTIEEEKTNDEESENPKRKAAPTRTQEDAN